MKKKFVEKSTLFFFVALSHDKEQTYILVTRSEGITYKRFVDITSSGVLMSADNTFYKPYEILLTDIYEIWEFACAINTEEFILNNLNSTNLKVVLDNL